jgi:hypothetical protein
MGGGPDRIPVTDLLHHLLCDVHLVGRIEDGKVIVTTAMDEGIYNALCEWDAHEGREPDIDDEKDDPPGSNPER